MNDLTAELSDTSAWSELLLGTCLPLALDEETMFHSFLTSFRVEIK